MQGLAAAYTLEQSIYYSQWNGSSHEKQQSLSCTVETHSGLNKLPWCHLRKTIKNISVKVWHLITAGAVVCKLKSLSGCTQHVSIMNAHMLIAQTDSRRKCSKNPTMSFCITINKQRLSLWIQQHMGLLCENNEKNNNLRITCKASGSRLGHSCRANDPSWSRSWSKHSYESYIIEQAGTDNAFNNAGLFLFNELRSCEYVISTNRWHNQLCRP